MSSEAPSMSLRIRGIDKKAIKLEMTSPLEISGRSLFPCLRSKKLLLSAENPMATIVDNGRKVTNIIKTSRSLSPSRFKEILKVKNIPLTNRNKKTRILEISFFFVKYLKILETIIPRIPEQT